MRILTSAHPSGRVIPGAPLKPGVGPFAAPHRSSAPTSPILRRRCARGRRGRRGDGGRKLSESTGGR
jgi:hypothetical protein